jgi:hypothetical protein
VNNFKFTRLNVVIVGQDRSVSIAIRYGMYGPEIEYRWGRDFPHRFRLVLAPIQLPVQKYRISFPKVKESGHGTDCQPPLGAEVQETVELYLYPPLWSVLGWTLILPDVTCSSPKYSPSILAQNVQWKIMLAPEKTRLISPVSDRVHIKNIIHHWCQTFYMLFS